MIKGFRDATEAIGNGLASDLSPSLKFLDGKKLKVLNELLEMFTGNIRKEFNEHKKTLDPSEFVIFKHWVLSKRSECA